MLGTLLKFVKTIFIILFSFGIFILLGNVLSYVAALFGVYGTSPLILMGLPDFSFFETNEVVQSLVNLLVIFVSALLGFVTFVKMMQRFVV